MYEYIKGTLVQCTPEKAIVACSGIGYSIHIPLSIYAQLPKRGEEVQLFLSFVVREDRHTLFGFLTEDQRNFFEKLHAISGIGPKTALSLIGHLDLNELKLAIANQDVRSFSAVPGIGKKTAERLIVELRDKVMKDTPKSPLSQDALSALLNLGYSQNAAQKALSQVMKEDDAPSDLPSLITSTLKKISK